MNKLTVYVGSLEDGYFLDVELTADEEAGVRKLVAAAAAKADPTMGPWLKIPTDAEAATL